MCNIFFILLVACFIHNGSTLFRIDPLVDTKVGLIRGLKANDGDYSMFMGIPYATVNESNPFGPSIPHPGFDEIFEAYDDSAICPQVEEFNNTIVGSLDCLHLNIYVPSSAHSKNKLPVLVWIYGGGFSIGFSGRYLYGPRHLVQKDVILVTFNYRLGPYGFMCLGTPDIPGNQGLKDQQLALRWIKENIESFGGDSNKITIFGQSAGGASVDFHLTYGKEKLFDKVIMQSGTVLCPWAILEPDASAPIKLATHLGLETTNINEAVEFLAKSDPALVIGATSELDFIFRPCIEESFDGVQRFIHEYPVNIKNYNVANIPILIGFTSDEALYLHALLAPEDYDGYNTFQDYLEKYFKFDPKVLSQMESEVRKFYIGDEKMSEEVKDGVIRFDSDFSFNYPIQRTIDKYLDSGAENIYFYVFSYDGKRNFVKNLLNITTAGTAHTDEIGYLFDISYDNDDNIEDELITARLSTMWTNFAKHGNPIPAVTELLPLQWPPVTKEVLYNLKIDSDFTIEKRTFKDRVAFWNLFYKLNEKYQLGYKG